MTAPRKPKRRVYTSAEDHAHHDDAKWAYAKLHHLARLVVAGDPAALKMAEAMTTKTRRPTDGMHLAIEDGAIVVRESGGWVMRFLTATLGEALDQDQAENYLAMAFRTGGRDLYEVVLQRCGKLTPHEARRLAEGQRDAALAEVARLKAELAALRAGPRPARPRT